MLSLQSHRPIPGPSLRSARCSDPRCVHRQGRSLSSPLVRPVEFGLRVLRARLSWTRILEVSAAVRSSSKESHWASAAKVVNRSEVDAPNEASIAGSTSSSNSLALTSSSPTVSPRRRLAASVLKDFASKIQESSVAFSSSVNVSSYAVLISMVAGATRSGVVHST